MLLPLCLHKVPHRSHVAPRGRPRYADLPPGGSTRGADPVEQAAASIWGAQRGVVIIIPFHTPAHVHPAGGGALSLVCGPTWPLLAGLWDFPPVCGVEVHSPGGRGGWSVTEAPREAHVHTLAPTSPAQGPCRLHPGPKQCAAEGLKGTPGGTEEPRGPDLPALGVGSSARPEAPGHGMLQRAS